VRTVRPCRLLNACCAALTLSPTPSRLLAHSLRQTRLSLEAPSNALEMGAAVSAIQAVGSVVQALAPIAITVAQIIPLFRRQPRAAPAHVEAPAPVATLSREEMIAQAQRNLGLDAINNYNFAICGQSGTGKSSLINAIRGLYDDDAAAAPVNEVECTMAIRSYPMTDLPHVYLWDMPGAGTASHPAESYFEGKSLYAFDFLVLVTAERFTEAELQVARKAADWNVPIVFVRQKFDVSFTARRRRMRAATEEQIKEQLRQEIVANILSQLSGVRLGDRKIFLVSAPAMLGEQGAPRMDEVELIEHITTTAAQRRQR